MRSRRRGGDSVGTYFGDAWSLAKRTAVGLNEIRKLINVEQKYFDLSSTSSSGQSGTVTFLSGLAQGDDINLRNGDSIRIQQFEIKGCVFRNSASTVNDTIRIMVVRDLQNSGATISGSDVLQLVGTSTAPYSPPNVLNGPTYNKRFSIVYDQLFAINANDQNRPFEFSTSHPCHTYYRGSGATVAAAGNGSYFFLAFSNSSTNVPSVDFITRIQYTDN